MLSNCGQNEYGKYAGGQKGDQNRKEWALIPWYNRPWKCVLRHPDAQVRQMISQMAIASAKNDNVGYDQPTRLTFWYNLADSNYDPAQITVKCSADCSSGVSAIVKAAGKRLGRAELFNVNSACTTSNLRKALQNAGFQVITENKYLTSDKYLLAGDILLNDGNHVAINVSAGTGAQGNAQTTTQSNVKIEAARSKDASLAGAYKVVAKGLNLRAGAGTSKKIVAVMQQDDKVQCYGFYTEVSGTKWLYVTYNGVKGFASSRYLERR